jgi:N-acetylglucosaminyl-diphospho-decaprenol L-rhamnosyltransferase
MDISVLIVAYNSAGQIARCLESLAQQTGINFEVIVVDNASKDDTLAQCRKFGHIRMIPSPENLGFGRGNNLGFAASTGRYIYLLNPDARLVGTGALVELCRGMDAHSRWGLAASRVRSEDGTHEEQPATGYPGQRHVPHQFAKLPGGIAWILGASMIVRRELYEQLGGFDPAFFLYSEETDFCLRVRKAGYEIGQILEVTVEHIGGASEDRGDPYDVSARKLRGLIIFRQKHYSPADCRRLAERDLRRARIRARWNGFLAWWQPARSPAWQKSRNYSAIRDVSLEYLAATK